MHRRIMTIRGMGRRRDGPWMTSISCENLTQLSSPVGSGVEQLKRSAVDGFVATQNVARLRRQLENEPDEFTRSALLKLLLHEAEKSCLTGQQLDRIDHHMARIGGAG